MLSTVVGECLHDINYSGIYYFLSFSMSFWKMTREILFIHERIFHWNFQRFSTSLILLSTYFPIFMLVVFLANRFTSVLVCARTKTNTSSSSSSNSFKLYLFICHFHICKGNVREITLAHLKWKIPKIKFILYMYILYVNYCIF